MAVVGAFCVSVMKSACVNARMPGKCATCVEVCPYDVYALDGGGQVSVQNFNACVGCRICAEFCPGNAIRINSAEPEAITRALWTFPIVEEIHYKALTGQYLMRGFGTMGPQPHFDSIAVVPAQLASPLPRDTYREDCRMDVVIGEGKCERPMQLKRPIVFPAMSFGALSREAKQALAICAAQMGIASNTGEGGLLPGENDLARGYGDDKRTSKRWEPGGYLVVQWSTGRFGVSVDYVRAGDAVEIKIGQGAKPGMGGHLLAKKVTAEIAAVRGLPPGIDALSPSRFYDVQTHDDLAHMVTFLREVTDYQIPIMIKIGPSRPYADVRVAAEAGVDAISIDGAAGGTGASPDVVTQGVGIPTVACITPAVRALQDMGLHHKVKLIALGGLRGGLDAFKALAMGADAVGFGTAAEIALGCRACMACHKGECSYGITSQDPRLRARLDPEEGARRLTNFVHATTEEIKILTMLTGHAVVTDLSQEDLRALDLNTAAITGLKLIGLEKRLPWWDGAAADGPAG